MASEDDKTTGAAVNGQQEPAQFSLDKIYIRDLSFEAPLGVQSFTQQWKPSVSQDVSTRINAMEGDRFEVILTVTATLKDNEAEKTIYLVEVQQAGVFQVKGVPQDKLPQLLNTQCPNLLFPYAREAVDNIVVKGGFPPLNLPPVNFDVLFFHAMKQAQEKAQQEQAPTH